MDRGKRDFVTIGQLAKMTGVHPQSLRYYERLGILSPAYVNATTGYRYYTFEHIRLVEAIQYCVELDIPLNEFHEFLSEEDGRLDYASFIERGRILAEEKIRVIHERMVSFEAIYERMMHGENLLDKGSVEDRWPERLFCVERYEGPREDATYLDTTFRLLARTRAAGASTTYDTGILVVGTGKTRNRYAFLEIAADADTNSGFPGEILHIPAGTYRCTTSPESRIDSIVREHLDAGGFANTTFIIERDHFKASYEFRVPNFEIQELIG